MDLEVLLVVMVFNAPLTAVVVAVFMSPWLAKRKLERALAEGRCQKKVKGVPGGVCGMPIAARMDVREAYEYRFFQVLCYEHALDAERREHGRLYAVHWLEDEDLPPHGPVSHGAAA